MWDLSSWSSWIADVGPIVLAFMGARLAMIHNLARRDPEKRLWTVAFFVVGALVSAASIYAHYQANLDIKAAQDKQQQIFWRRK